MTDLPPAMISDPRQFGKVAVLLGGVSSEREISLKSGNAVLEGLRKRDIDAHAIDVGEDVVYQLEQGGFDRAFIVLHGKGGEDGVIQGVLEMLDIPYTGSGVLGSALGLDKLRSKFVWNGAGLPTPQYKLLDGKTDFFAVGKTLGLPLIVKPACEGSSLGMSKVTTIEELPAAWQAAHKFGGEVFAEQWVSGAEYTAAILGGVVLPLIRVETPRTFYDFDAKYSANDTQYHCPCGLDSALENEIQMLARRAFETVGCRGWGRVDLICDQQNRPWLIEVNTVPGMTDHSLVPMAAKAAGLGFDELVWRILETSMEMSWQMEGRH